MEIVKWLVEEGKAEVDKAMQNGTTLLEVAKVAKKDEIIKYLKGKRAKD